MSHMDFTSWPRDQEQTFVVYEQHSVDSQKKALIASVIAGLATLFLILGIYAGVEPDKRDVTKGMNMSNLTKKGTAPAPSTAPAPARAPSSSTAPAPTTQTPAPAPAPASDKK